VGAKTVDEVYPEGHLRQFAGPAMGCSIQPSPAENIFGFIAASEIIMQEGFGFFVGGGAAPPLGINKCSAHDEPAGGRTSLLAGEKFPSGPLV